MMAETVRGYGDAEVLGRRSGIDREAAVFAERIWCLQYSI